MRSHLETVQHVGNVSEGADWVDRVRMQIDTNSTAFLMSVLTDLYSDPELAVIREYSTNALDSHRAAGNSAPIEVELPSSLRPTFVVRDHGLGMSLTEVTENFSKYGWSSKRDTDEAVGMLGLGCKSGLTYTSQFTFVTNKDGVRAQILVTRDTDGTGAIQVIDTRSTDEPNGVEIQIPVKDARSFVSKAEHFFRFWEEGTVLVNGEAPRNVRDAAIVDDGDYIVTESVPTNFIVMGNVPYPVSQLSTVIPGYRNKIVKWVPIGMVDFTPSRESLHMTKRTKETITKISVDIDIRLTAKAAYEVSHANNYFEALECSEKWRNLLTNNPTFIYKGELVPQYPIKFNGLYWYSTISGFTNSADAKAERCHSLSINQVKTGLFLVGHTGRTLLRSQKDRLKQYMAQNDLNGKIVFACNTMPDPKWLRDGLTYVTMDELRKIPLPKRATLAPQLKTLDRYANLREIDPEDLKDDIVYVLNPTTRDQRNTLARFFQEFENEVSLVTLNKTQLDKFRKAFPHAMTPETFVKAINYLYMQKIDPRIIVSIKSTEIHYSHIKYLFSHKSTLLDRELVDLIDFVERQYDSKLSREESIHNSLVRMSKYLSIEPPEVKDTLTERLNKIDERYPLIKFCGAPTTISEAALADYVNLVYRDLKERKLV